MVKCRVCGVDLYDRDSQGEIESEIMFSDASMEGRMSDLNNMDICSRCLGDQAMRR